MRGEGLGERIDFREMAEASPDCVKLFDLEGELVYINGAGMEEHGLDSFEEALEWDYCDTLEEDYRVEVMEAVEEAMEGETTVLEVRHTEEGSDREWCLESVSPVERDGEVIGVLYVSRDISERKEKERELRESNRVLEQIFSTTNFLLAYMDSDFDFIRVNEAYAASDNREPDFFPGRNHFELYPDEENRRIFEQVVETGEPFKVKGKAFEYGEHPERGTTYWDWSLLPVKDQEGEVRGLLLSLVDVTERERERLRLREAQRTGRVGSWEWDVGDDEVHLSDEGKRIFGGVLGRGGNARDTFLEHIPSRDREYVEEAIETSLREGESYEVEHRFVVDGEERVLYERGEPVADQEGEILKLVGTVQDVTESRERKEQLASVNRALRTLSASNEALIRSEDEGELLEEICRVAVEEGGYRLAWVGMAREDEEKSVEPVAQHGYEEGYLESIRISWGESERGRGTAGLAIKEGEPAVAQDIETDPRFEPWREEALERGYSSSISLPLDLNHVEGVLNIYAEEPDAFEPEEVELLNEMAEDLAYGIRSLRTRRAAERSREQVEVLERVLRHNLRNKVNVLMGHLGTALDESKNPVVRENIEVALDTSRILLNQSEKVRRIRKAYGEDGPGRYAIDLAGLVRREIEEMEKRHPEAEVVEDLPGEEWVRASEVVRYAVEEVIENAVVHSDREQPRIEISSRRVEKERGEYVELKFADDGPTISEEERGVVEQGRETPLEHATGLGLWMVSWCVRGQEGEVEFQEREPRGNLVTITLEAAEPPRNQ